MKLRVIVADDHPVVLAGLRPALERDGHIEVVGVAGGVDELIELMSVQGCEIVISDFSMPGGLHRDGLGLVELIRYRFPGVALIILTMMNNAAMLQAAHSQGALGLFDKRSSIKELIKAIAMVVAGRPYVSESFQEKLLGWGQVSRGETVRLSPREMEVLRLYAGGLSVNHISIQLKRSAKTVSAQKRQAMRKLGLTNDGHLIEYARSSGIV
jgi:two-component system, NarL family, captular synthesis response regulator RcsB